MLGGQINVRGSNTANSEKDKEILPDQAFQK